MFGTLSPPSVPLDTLPKVIGEFVNEQAELMGADPSMMAGACLVATAAVISDAFKVQPKQKDTTWKESPRLWAALVGDISSKKTPSLKAAVDPLRKLDAKVIKESERQLKRYGAEKAAFEKRSKSADGHGPGAAQEPERPPFQQILADDYSIEALSEVLKDNPAGVLVFHDELASWVGGMDAYRQTTSLSRDRGLWLNAYNGGERSIGRIQRGRFLVPNWSACILGGIQPDMIKRCARDLEGDGLLARFMIIQAGPLRDEVDRTPNATVLSAYSEMLDKLFYAKAPDEPFELSIDAGKVRERIVELFKASAVVSSTSKALAAHLGKWSGLFARLILVWHLANHALSGHAAPQVIPEATAGAVERFMTKFLLPHAVAFYVGLDDGDEAVEHAKWIAGFILSRKLDKLAMRNIHQSYKAMKHATHPEVSKVMDILANLGWCRPLITIGKKAPTTWLVNPNVHDGRYAIKADAERNQREATAKMMRSIFENASDDEL